MVAFVMAAVGFAFVQERSAVNDRRSTLDGLQAKVAQTHAASGSLGGRRYGDAGAPRRDHVGRVRADGVGRSARPALARHASRDLARDPPGERRRRHVPDDDTDAVVDAVDLDDDVEQPCLEVVVLDERHRPATGAAPTGFVVTGSARSQAAVARALDRLALIPALSDVTLQSTQRADVAGKQALQFTIGANLRSTGGIAR